MFPFILPRWFSTNHRLPGLMRSPYARYRPISSFSFSKSTGFEKWASIPARRADRTSSSNALAVMATIGTDFTSSRPRLRIALVAS